MSSVKRSRMFRSSSLGDSFMVDQLRPIEPPVSRLVKRTSPVQIKPLNISKPSVIVKPSDQSRRKILTIGSPEREISNARSESIDHERVGGFCEKCYSCEKKIGAKDDVFMYSYLRAFCSPKCRDKQITLDKKAGKGPDNSIGSKGMESWWKGTTGFANFV